MSCKAGIERDRAGEPVTRWLVIRGEVGLDHDAAALLDQDSMRQGRLRCALVDRLRDGLMRDRMAILARAGRSHSEHAPGWRDQAGRTPNQTVASAYRRL